jgi:type VI secretion system protein ImpB
MAAESIHEKLQRVRRPHVHIKYEVYTDGAKQLVELPFVVGVMGDFAGDSEQKPLREREFTEINRDNFQQTLSSISPSLNLRVDDRLTDDKGKELSVNLKFQNMDDFTPAGVARQVPELNEMLKVRERLNELKASVDRSSELEQALDGILKDPALRKALTDELGKDSPTA